MELGGNKNAQIYYEKNGMMVDGKPNHKAAALTKYKSDLSRKAEQALGIQQSQAVQAVTKPQEEKGQESGITQNSSLFVE